ncbi:MAG: hypothetical protein ACOX6Q_03480 [Candidatus Dojkabacteria bacterium]|jgi:hypothetical protein
MKKLFTLILLVFVVCLTVVGVKYITRSNPKNILDIGKEQKIFKEELTPQIVKTENTTPKIYSKTKVYVPYHWKDGYTDKDTSDYLKGYIPSISNFRQYYTMYQNLKFGVSKHSEYNLEELTPLLSSSNSYEVKGLLNESVYFDWNIDECKSLYSESLNANIFYCKNWLNWSGIQKDQKDFVFTKCTVSSKDGYCMFEDYVHIYYNLKTKSEVRCFGTVTDDYLCSFDDYLSLIKI